MSRPWCPRELRFVVRERIGPRPGGRQRPEAPVGPLVEPPARSPVEPAVEPLDESTVAAAADALRAASVQDGPVEAVAVCLLFAFLDPTHERRVRDLLADALPGVRVTLSSDVLPEFREYERLTTTVADAYLTPKLGDYLLALAERGARRGLAEPLVMQSSGGVEPLRAAAAHAATCLLSGPAAGVVGAAYVAGLSGHVDLLTFDMGGTSTDVAPVIGGAVQTTAGTVLGGVPVRLPAVDVHSVSAGGGSIAWIDEGGALRVGPHSAGAEPGPACYGHGGEQATVTDANLVLGHLADGDPVGRRRQARRRPRPRGAGEAGRAAGRRLARPGRGRRRDRRGRGRRDGPGPAGGERAARAGPAHVHPGGLRRRRRHARLRARRRAGHSPGARARRVRGAVGPRAGRR